MKKIRSILEYLGAFLIIFVLLTIIASVVLVKFYGNDIQDYTMDLINDQLDTKVSVDEMGINVLRKFPNTSVFFNDLTVWSGHQFKREEFTSVSPDTLFAADRLYVEFNILSLLRKKFNIKSLEARGAVLRVLIDSEGKGNFLLTKSSSSGDASRFIEMNGVVFRDVELFYLNNAKDILAELTLTEMFFEGNFSREDYLLKIGGSANIDLIKNQGVSYITRQEMKTNISMQVNKNRYNIEKGEVSLGNLSAEMNGEFLVDPEVGVDLDLHFTGKRIDLAWISDILANSADSKTGISGKGSFDLSASLIGLSSPTLSPHLEAEFSTINSSLRFDKIPLNIHSLSMQGTYSNGVYNNPSSSIIKLNSFAAKVENSSISGNLKFENFVHPRYSVFISGELVARELAGYFPDIPLKISGGSLHPELTVKGDFSSNKKGLEKYNLSPTGTISLNDIKADFKKVDLAIDSLNGIFKITSSSLSSDIKGKVGNSDFSAKLTSNNFLNSLSSPFINLKGEMHSRNVDIDQLASKLQKENTKDKKPEPYVFPNNIKLNLDFNFDKISIGEIQTRQVNGTLIYTFPALYIEPVYLETMNGAINSKIALMDLNMPVYQLNTSSTFRNVEIKNLFTSYNNFGQNFLTDQNIAGNISGESRFISSINADFSFNTHDIVSENSFTIKNGELNNFQPLMEMSKFLKIDKMDHIVFSNITNTILINNNKITIPEMEIKSSAINIQASGEHSFDKKYDYHLATRLSELLFSKAQSSRKSEFEIALDKEDHRTIFLHLYDEGEGVMVEFDEDQVMKKIKSDLKGERNELKSVFQEEFGTHKNDPNQKGKNETPAFKFEFPDEPGTDSVKNDSSEQSKWWKRKKVLNKKEELEFVIDEEDL